VDVKLLREVDADGLERWEPVLKLGFPLPAAEVATVFDVLGVAASPRTRDAYTLDQFLAELAEPSGLVRAVAGGVLRAMALTVLWDGGSVCFRRLAGSSTCAWWAIHAMV
jgi:hypothetical protein